MWQILYAADIKTAQTPVKMPGFYDVKNMILP